MDIGMTTECKVGLTPEHDKAVYSQSLPKPIHLKVYSIVELAPMHKYGIFTVLPFSKYASPISAQNNPLKTTSPCGSQENQHPHCGWLY